MKLIFERHYFCLIDNSQAGVAAVSISSVINQRQNPYALAQLGAGQASATAVKAKTADAASATLAINSNESVNMQTDAKSIMAKYDLTNITYSDMAKLGKELVASGALPEDKLLDFIPIDPSRISVDGSIRESSNTSVNMIATQENIVASIKNFGGKGADYATMVLNMYKNFQALHTQ